LKEVVEKLLTKDYRRRPDIEEILRFESMTEKMRLYGYTLPAAESLKFAPKRAGAFKSYN